MAFINPSVVKRATTSRGGYDLKGAKVFTKAGKVLTDFASFTCPLCQFILRNPHQLLECGCRYCQPCVDDLLNKPDPKCLEDGEPVAKDEVRLDKGCQREINSLKVECPGSERSCMWTGGLTDYEEHFDKCPFVLTTCKCGEQIIREDMITHTLSCRLNIDEGLDSRSMGYDSMQGLLACQYPDCVFTGDADTINLHCMEHMYSLSKLLISLQTNMKHLESDYDRIRQSEETLVDQIGKYSDQLISLREDVSRIPALENRVSELQEELKQVRKVESDSAHLRVPYGMDSPPSSWGSTTSRSLGTSGDEYVSLAPRVARLEEDIRTLKPIMQHAQAEIHSQKGKLVGYIDTVQTLQESVTRHSVTLDEVKLRQDILDVKTVHGVFIWKIPEIARRFRDAKDKRTISLYSPPFHTSPHGYRACIRAYLNGDGSGKDSHISVFFVLMKSEHDNLLKWPFERPVTFELVNQESRSESITETFMPEKRSASFQQPKSEMNVASGFPRFAPHSVLAQHQFTKGDALYVRCKIDTNGLNFD